MQEYLTAVELGPSAAGIEELVRQFARPWWEEVIRLAVALPEQRVFGPLLKAVLVGGALPAASELLPHVVREAHVVPSVEFVGPLTDEAVPAASRAAVLRALLHRADPDLLSAAKRLVDH
ncbi:MAG: hypothetical protein ABI895_17765, partial [Deltaproteobacteria bacterium]